MPQFKEKEPVVQTDPVVKVEVSRANPIKAGAHQFQLVVVDDEGNESEPVVLDIVVNAVNAPTAVLDMVNSDGKRVEPVAVEGKSFTLSAARSSDVEPGKIVEYRFTLLS